MRTDIETLERDGELAETQGLSAAEKSSVLAELKSIMAVYGDSCRLAGEL